MAIFLIGLILRAAYFTWAPPDYAAADTDYDEIAQNLVAGKGFSLPLDRKSSELGAPDSKLRAVPVATRTPAYPLFLAAIYKVFGRRVRLVYAAQAFLDMLSALLLYALTLRITGSDKAAMLSAFMYALYMPFMSQTAILLNEPLFNFLILAFCLLAVWAFDKPSFLRFSLAGAALGLTTLCRPTTFLFPAFFVGTMLILHWKQLRKTIVPSLAFVAGFMLIIAPWVIRNYIVLDYFGLVGSLAGEQIYAANYESKNPDQPTPMVPEEMTVKLAGKSDLERSRILSREGLKEILRHPLRFAKNILLKTPKFWTAIGMGKPAIFYYSSSRAGKETCVFVAVVNVFLIAASIMAFVRIRGAWKLKSLIPILLLGYFYIVHLPIIALIRYSMPVIPFLMIFAAGWIVWVFSCESALPDAMRPPRPAKQAAS